METTPTNRCLRPRHVPTPKLSERKKKLFQDAKETSTTILINNVIDEGDENSDLGPMSPLQFSSSPSSFQRLHSNSKGNIFFYLFECFFVFYPPYFSNKIFLFILWLRKKRTLYE